MLTQQTESKPLNPCPFCGGHAHLFVLENENVPEQEPDYLVICKCCGAEGPCSDNPFKAERWWNGKMRNIAIRERKEDEHMDEILEIEQQHNIVSKSVIKAGR